MQRILSVETSRMNHTERKFVTKRFCYSILFSVAFLFLLAGYLLGRYTTDRAILLKKAYLQQKFILEEKNPMEIMKNLSATMRNIHNITVLFHMDAVDSKELHGKLLCSDHKAFLPGLGDFEKDVAYNINKMLTIHLDNLANCYASVDNLLRNISSTNN